MPGVRLKFEVQCPFNRFQVGSAQRDLNILHPDITVVDGGDVSGIDAIGFMNLKKSTGWQLINKFTEGRTNQMLVLFAV